MGDLRRLASGRKGLAFALLCAVALIPVAPAAQAGSVRRIDTGTDQLIGDPIGVGDVPENIAVKPDGAEAYTTNTTANSVSIINTQTNVVTATVSLIGQPQGVDFTRDNREAYVAINCISGSSVGSVSVINTTTHAVLDITVGRQPYGVAVGPDGTPAAGRAYVTDTNFGRVFVIDTSTHTLRPNSIQVGSQPLGIAISPNGNFAYVANNGAGTVSVVDLISEMETAVVQVEAGPEGTAITPDGAFVYTTNERADSVSVIRTSDNQVVARIAVAANPEKVAIGQTINGVRAFVTSEVTAAVTVIDVATNQIVDTLTSGFVSPEGVAFTPDGRIVYMTDEAGFAGPGGITLGCPI